MATSTTIPVEEYLTTSYSPDREWVDGELLERNMGEGPHSAIQKIFILLFGPREREWGVRIWPEQRVQTSEQHYRVPDLAVTRWESPFERIIHVSPLLCIEILSSDDRMSEMHAKIEDYLDMGVESVWIIDPWRRKAFMAMGAGEQTAPVAELTVPGTSIFVRVSEIFAYLDDLGG